MPFALQSPWYLLAGLGALIPVVLHLIQRRREVILPFSMVRFVAEAQRRSARRLRLHRLLLLLMRAAAFLLLALILSRPVSISPGAVSAGDVAGATVVVLDNSLSLAVRTGEGSRFEEMRDWAGRLAAAAPAGEEFALVAAAPGEGRVPRWGDAAAFTRELDGVRLRPREADFTTALTTAYGLLSDRTAAGRRILLLTDLAPGGWENFSLLDVAGVDREARIRIVTFGAAAADNRAGILAAEVRGESRLAGESLQVAARVAAYAGGGSVPVELWLNDRLADRLLLSLSPGDEAEALFNLRLPAGGLYRGDVRLDEDRYREDDRRLFGLSLAPPVSVLVVDGDPGASLMESETFFLREALRSERLAFPPPVSVTVVTAAGFAGSDPGRYGVIVLANLAVPEGAAANLAAFTAGGGGLVIFWGPRCRASDWRGTLSPILPVRLGAVQETEESVPFQVGEFDGGDPLLSVFRPPGDESLRSARFQKRAGVTGPAPGARVLARFADGTPWIAAGRAGAGRIVFFSSTADLEWNDLAARPAYVPLVQRAVLGAAGALDPPQESEQAAGVPRVFEDREGKAGDAVVVTTPTGRRVEVPFEDEGGVRRAVFTGTEERGLYSWHRGGRDGVFAVNAPPRESDLRPLDEETLRGRFAGTEITLTAGGGESGAAPGEGTRSLVRPLFVLFFLLLIAETLVAGPRLPLFARRRRQDVHG